MNSAVELITAEMSPANDSKTLPKKDSDDNANLSFNCVRGQCTGAIPKTKSSNKPNSSHPNNCIKVNNNVDKISTKKCPTSSNDDMCQTFSDTVKNNVNRSNAHNSFVLRPSCSRLSTESQCCLEKSKPPDVLLPQNNFPCDSSSQENKCLILPYSLNNEAASNSLKQSKHSESDSNSDSDTANEDAISVFDDSCIYTYKGDDHVDELSSVFLNLEIPPPVVNGINNAQKRPSNRSCSPETDYLEMDFDPGQPCDEDSDLETIDAESKNACAQSQVRPPLLVKSELRKARSPPPDTCFSLLTSDVINLRKNQQAEAFHKNEMGANKTTATAACVNSTKSSAQADDYLSQPGPSGLQKLNNAIPEVKAASSVSSAVHLSALHLQPTPSTSRDTSAFASPKSAAAFIPFSPCKFHQGSNGYLLSPSTCAPKPISSPVSPVCNPPPTPAAEHLKVALSAAEDEEQQKQRSDPSSGDSTLVESPPPPPLEEAMIWSEEEACLRQTMQVAPSACGATAVINVLSAFDMKVPSVDLAMDAVPTRKRARGAPILHYLLSRSVAGSTHQDLIRGVETLSEGRLYARFFHMFPDRNVNLNHWLSYWIKNGAVPIATMNLQRGLVPDGDVPDAWHHQMIYGVGPNGVHLTNPLECKNTNLLSHQLSSESILLIRRADVIEHWTDTTDIRDLMRITDRKWRKINVVGQVANMIREYRRPHNQMGSVTAHIRIPASYSAGVTLVVQKDTPEYHLLRQATELTLAQPSPPHF